MLLSPLARVKAYVYRKDSQGPVKSARKEGPSQLSVKSATFQQCMLTSGPVVKASGAV